MTDKSSSKNRTASPAPGNDDPAAECDRQTLSPPFDVEAFAREATAASQLASTRPPPGGGAADEMRPGSEASRITITNEAELEAARLASINLAAAPPASTENAPPSGAVTAVTPSSSSDRGSPPPPPRGPNSTRSSTSALWLADALAPSGPPPRDPGPVRTQLGVDAAVPVPGRVDGGSQAPPEITERTIEDPVAEMRERQSLGDYSGAFEMAALILVEDPGNVDATACLESCRRVLENMYATRIGTLDRAPIVIVARAQLQWLSIDHRAGFVLSLIDGRSSVEMIVDVSGMPKLDALRILDELLEQKIIAFRP